jgi:UDP-N-acetylmuramate dehydrogenase
MSAGLTPLEHVPLAPRCSMRVGGPARYLVEAHDEATVREALAWTRAGGQTLRILGGGTNLVVADEGVDGLVLAVDLRGVSVQLRPPFVELTAAAGEPWDDLVRFAVERGWAGIECLSGIPGLVGATPIQNVGAYGQEVSETVLSVRALDTRDGAVRTLSPAECRFAYRDSIFKSGEPRRWVVLAVCYRLRPGGAATIRYPEVEQYLTARGIEAASLADARASVLAIRRAKSMVLDPDDINRRSCGSFFVNPVVSVEHADRLMALGLQPPMPRWPQPDGRVKLSAAWLIERAGFPRGYRKGSTGLSTRHALAIVAYDGARARGVLAFARRLQEAVRTRFGITLVPEPVFWS